MGDPAYSYTLGFTVEGVLIGLILVQCMAYSHTWYLGWLNNRILVFIGVISYAMYLYHELAAAVALKASAYLSNMLDISIGQYVAGFVGFVITVIAAYFSYIVIEKPILRLRNRKVFTLATEAT